MVINVEEFDLAVPDVSGLRFRHWAGLGDLAGMAAQPGELVIENNAREALIDVRDPDWKRRARALLQDVTELVALLGGTLAAEHGDGRLRTPLMFVVWDARAMALFARVKQAFDPVGILNPGVKLPCVGDDPLESVKYDPSLPPLPHDARVALDTVVRERAWAAYRLGLLPGE